MQGRTEKLEAILTILTNVTKLATWQEVEDIIRGTVSAEQTIRVACNGGRDGADKAQRSYLPDPTGFTI
jgi:hypothetical protein